MSYKIFFLLSLLSLLTLSGCTVTYNNAMGEHESSDLIDDNPHIDPDVDADLSASIVRP